MERDFVTDLIYHIFAEEKKEKPMPRPAKSRLLARVKETILRLAASNRKKMERELWNEKN